MKNKAILFDLDGTLINTDILIIRSYLHVFDTFRPDYKLNIKELLSFLGPPLKDIFPKYFKEDFTTLLKCYHEYSFKNIKKCVFLYDGVEKMLQKFKQNGYVLGVVTNRYLNSALEVLEPFDIKKYFDVIVTLDDVEAKPSPDGILKAIAELNANIDYTIYVGDSFSDYKASINAGIRCGLVSWLEKENVEDLKPNYLIKNFDEFVTEVLNEKD